MVSNPKKYPKTSLPSVQNYVDAFMPHIRAGRGVICVCITTSLSGSYNSAVNARDIICEDYPDAKIAAHQHSNRPVLLTANDCFSPPLHSG